MRAVLLAVPLVIAPAAWGQVPGPVCTLTARDGDAPSAHRSARQAWHASCDSDGERLPFLVTYDGFPAEAQESFQAAVDVWSCNVTGDIPVRIAATWEPLGPGTLGSAGPTVYRRVPGAPSPSVWYPAALADQFAGRDLDAGRPDIEASFNSTFPDWHVGSGAPAPDAYDLFTVVLHEIGHGLGLIGALTVEDGRGRVGIEMAGPYAYDLQTEDGQGISLLDEGAYPRESLALARALQSAVVYDGAAVRSTGTGGVVLYAPPRWEAGGSYSHLDESTYLRDTGDGLMTPFIARGETVAAPGPVPCAMLADLGWGLAGPCADQVPARAPADDGLRVEWRGPNPVRTSTRLRINSASARYVEVTVVDALGRRVLSLGGTSVTASRPLDVGLDARSLATGIYAVQVAGGPRPVTVLMTVIR